MRQTLKIANGICDGSAMSQDIFTPTPRKPPPSPPPNFLYYVASNGISRRG
jgi:hypothetical protein